MEEGYNLLSKNKMELFLFNKGSSPKEYVEDLLPGT